MNISENNILSENNNDVLKGANNLNNEVKIYIRSIRGCPLIKIIKTQAGENLETYKNDLEEYLKDINDGNGIGENSMNLDKDGIIIDIENNIKQIEDMIQRQQGGVKFRYRQSKKNKRRKSKIRRNRSRKQKKY
jgi:hypothetical protein